MALLIAVLEVSSASDACVGHVEYKFKLGRVLWPMTRFAGTCDNIACGIDPDLLIM
jgi:hypothetical protein